eukprot:scaffold2499_cov125-Cylindrotheca_fusiformis.AAC.25
MVQVGEAPHQRKQLPRFGELQTSRTMIHPSIPQPTPTGVDQDGSSLLSPYTFVVCADSQIGMTSGNREWETELEYSRQAIAYINNLQPRPLFCCMCGDLVDMEQSFFAEDGFTRQECDKIQDQQNTDFKKTWSALHEDIAMVCLCGNHDVGNRPTEGSIARFKNAFGDDYLAFWVHNTSYHIVLNTNLFMDPSAAQDLYDAQLTWLEDRLDYARRNQAQHIFVFGHHPWFLYHDDEEPEDLTGVNPYPVEWEGTGLGGGKTDGYPEKVFMIPKSRRIAVMKLFEEFGVTAAFSGHFHQNLISLSSFGMPMIVTSSLSLVYNSTGKPKGTEPNTRGVRIVEVGDTAGAFAHHFVSLT